MKTHTLNTDQNKLIGKIGTTDRDRFEYELQIDLIGKAIRENPEMKTSDPGRTGQTHWHSEIPVIQIRKQCKQCEDGYVAEPRSFVK
jgi:hypothetical protein